MENYKKIGTIAIEKKWLTDPERDRLLAVQAQKRAESRSYEETLFGRILIEEGICTEPMLHTLLSEQSHSKEFLFRSLEQNKGHPFQFAQYTIEKLIAVGGMGSVFLAHNDEGKTFAIKIINWKNYHTKLEKRFLRENKILHKIKQIQHPNLVSIHEYNELDGIDYIVMDYIQGMRLDQVLNQIDFTSPKILKKFIDFLDGINAIHKIGIIHRDLKLSNIMYNEIDNCFILLDFGLSKIIKEGDSSSLVTTQILGSPPYMSPEQTYHGSQHDIRTDIWALGAIMYQMLTKKMPFEERDLPKLIYAIRFQQQKSIREHNLKLPWELDAICNCALQKDKAKRYQSVEFLAKDIHQFLEGKKIAASECYVPPLYLFKYRNSFLYIGYTIALLFCVLGTIGNFSIINIAALLIGIFLLFYFLSKQLYYIQINEKEILSGYNKFFTIFSCKWNEVRRIHTNSRITIASNQKIWKSPYPILLQPKNLRAVIQTHFQEREKKVQLLNLVLEGMEISEIAKKLNMEIGVVRTIAQEILEKLGSITSRA